MIQRIVPLFEQAQALGSQYANKQLQRGFVPKFISSLLDRAANFVGRSINWSGQLTEDKLADLGDDPSDEDIEQTLEDVAATVAETLAPTEIQDIVEQAVLNELKAAQVVQVVWVTEPGACNLCLDEEAKGPQPIEQAERPPKHQRCRCHLSPA